jgi:hypothetical protein
VTVSISTIKQQFISGSFVLHCSVIELEQCGATSVAKTYAGSGSITLDPREGFTGNFVTAAPVHLFTQFMVDQELVIGEIVPDSYFYRLRATAVDGTTWINPKVAIRVQPGVAGTLVTFRPDFLTTSRPAVDANRTAVAFVFLDTLPFPLTATTNVIQKGPGGEQTFWKRDGSRQETAKMGLTYQEWKEGTVHCEFTAVFTEPAPLGFENRVLEAIRFVTAVPASWVMLEYNQGGQVYLELCPYRTPQHHLIDAPLRASEHPDDFFRLLQTFYVHACGNTVGEEFSQLSTAIGSLFSLKGVDMAAISLVIGVAIEALLKVEFSDLEDTDPALVADVQAVEKMIDSMTEIPESTRNRMKGSMGGLKSTRAQDKLGKLQKMGLVTLAELEHWKKLRNTSAHGSLRVDPEKVQQHLQRIYSVATLAYKLAFLRIGYFGPYTDYGAPRWPTAWFPQKDDARILSRVTEQLVQLTEAEIEDKLYAWQAVDSALRTTFREQDAGASRVAAALVLHAAVMKAGALRLVQLRSNNVDG